MIYYDLNQETRRRSIGDAIGRDGELGRIARTLRRQFNNNVLVRGSSGTGKTALVEGFAYRAARKAIPGMEHFSFIKLDTGDLKKLFSQIGQPETFAHIGAAFKNIPENTVVIIDDFQNLVPHNQLFELKQLFAPFFESGGPRLIIAISEPGFAALNQEDPNFFQNFEDIALKESDARETESIIAALSPAFAQEYGVQTPAAAAKQIVELARKINSDKRMPLRAIHLLDECLAYAKTSGKRELALADIQHIFGEKTGVPSSTLEDSDAQMLKDLEATLAQNVIGQENAVKIIGNTVRRSRMGLRNPNRPYGSFLFLGPSGVGKTELSKVLAKIVYGSERAFTRIDMSEFGEQHTVQRLIGAPPGYVGYEAGGQLTNAVKNQPYSLVLLDEIEKAHPKVFDIFLQVLEDGRLSDGQGQLINFTNSIVIATSNIGIAEIVAAFESGRDLADKDFVDGALMPLLLQNFRMEFLNRFDAVIVFNPLGVEDLVRIARLEISKIEERTAQHKVRFNIDETTLAKKVRSLVDHRFGARPVKRFIEQTCENLIALKIMSARASGETKE